MKEGNSSPWTETPEIRAAAKEVQALKDAIAEIEAHCNKHGLFFADLPYNDTWVVALDVSSLDSRDVYTPANAKNEIQKIIKAHNIKLAATLIDGDLILSTIN